MCINIKKNKNIPFSFYTQSIKFNMRGYFHPIKISKLKKSSTRQIMKVYLPILLDKKNKSNPIANLDNFYDNSQISTIENNVIPQQLICCKVGNMHISEYQSISEIMDNFMKSLIFYKEDYLEKNKILVFADIRTLLVNNAEIPKLKYTKKTYLADLITSSREKLNSSNFKNLIYLEHPFNKSQYFDNNCYFFIKNGRIFSSIRKHRYVKNKLNYDSIFTENSLNAFEKTELFFCNYAYSNNYFLPFNSKIKHWIYSFDFGLNLGSFNDKPYSVEVKLNFNNFKNESNNFFNNINYTEDSVFTIIKNVDNSKVPSLKKFLGNNFSILEKYRFLPKILVDSNKNNINYSYASYIYKNSKIYHYLNEPIAYSNSIGFANDFKFFNAHILVKYLRNILSQIIKTPDNYRKKILLDFLKLTDRHKFNVWVGNDLIYVYSGIYFGTSKLLPLEYDLFKKYICAYSNDWLNIFIHTYFNFLNINNKNKYIEKDLIIELFSLTGFNKDNIHPYKTAIIKKQLEFLSNFKKNFLNYCLDGKIRTDISDKFLYVRVMEHKYLTQFTKFDLFISDSLKVNKLELASSIYTINYLIKIIKKPFYYRHNKNSKWLFTLWGYTWNSNLDIMEFIIKEFIVIFNNLKFIDYNIIKQTSWCFIVDLNNKIIANSKAKYYDFKYWSFILGQNGVLERITKIRDIILSTSGSYKIELWVEYYISIIKNFQNIGFLQFPLFYILWPFKNYQFESNQNQNYYFRYSEYYYKINYQNLLNSELKKVFLYDSKDVSSNFIDLGIYSLFLKYDLTPMLNMFFLILGLWAFLFYTSKLLSKKVFNLDKKSAYECGFEPFFILSLGIEVSFIVVAFVFLIFDLELIFLVGPLTTMGSLGSFGLIIWIFYILTIKIMLILEIAYGLLSWPLWGQINTEFNVLENMLEKQKYEERLKKKNNILILKSK